MLHNRKKYTIIAALFVTSSLLVTATLVNASEFAINQFTITKNTDSAGNIRTIFQDNFTNGVVADGGTFLNSRQNPASYSSAAGALPTTETGGQVLIDPFTGMLRTSGLTGQQIYVNQATLNMNTDQTNLRRGLKNDDTFSVTGLFDLTAPAEFKERFGVRLTDRGVRNAGANGTNGDVVEVDVRRLRSGVFVEFREQDRPNSTNIILGRVKLNYATLGLTADPFTLYDQIALKLERATTTGNIFGSFMLVDSSGTNADVLYNFGGAGAKIFDGENFTRAEYISVALAPVPEASSILLFAIGMLGLFSASRRKI